MFKQIALIAAIVLPFWNIPLIMRIIKRRSSRDISIYWVIGVWTCFLLMLPAGLASTDEVWRIFNIVNFVLFSVVFCVVLFYKRGNAEERKGD